MWVRHSGLMIPLLLTISPSILKLDASKDKSGECQRFQNYHIWWTCVTDKDLIYVSRRLLFGLPYIPDALSI
jgi:hypothetical protein